MTNRGIKGLPLILNLNLCKTVTNAVGRQFTWRFQAQVDWIGQMPFHVQTTECPTEQFRAYVRQQCEE